MRTRLHPLAVPSKFDSQRKVENIATAANSSIGQRISAEHNYFSLDEPSCNQLVNATIIESCNEEIHSSMVHLSPSTEFSSIALIQEPSFVQGILYYSLIL